MEYVDAAKAILEYFEKSKKTILNRKAIADLLGVDQKSAYRQYIRKMISEGLLSVGPDYYIRNDDVFKLLNGRKVYITRLKQDPQITLDEWMVFVKDQDDLRNNGYAEAMNILGQTAILESEGMCLWINHSMGHKVWFDYNSGSIVVRNPDQETRIKMFEIAEKFNAIVNSEDGDVYGADGLRVVE